MITDPRTHAVLLEMAGEHDREADALELERDAAPPPKNRDPR